MHISNYFPYHPFRHTYVPIRVVRVPCFAIASALSGLYGLSDEFFVTHILQRAR
jgi:hypothetical protein